ncbi:hypothetical protein RIF29_37858 [Crotalaria pallida]|uniref:Uncharacterized protein n=1 Tax=Crotalaria pallida TaxID=3830 RepID=A0AAN9HN89_CROPI
MADPVSYGNPDRDIEQVFFALKKGSQLVKYSRKGKPKFCPFRLSPDGTTLIWISRGREKNLNLSSVTRIIPGQRTAVFRRYLRPEKDYLSFSLIYKKGERSLDLICKDKAEVEVWLEGLRALTSTGQRIRRTRSDFTDDSIDSVHKDRPFVGTLEFTSSIARGRFSFESDVGAERQNMLVRTSIGDGSRVSVSSIGYASSVGSGPEDIESLGDVYIWGEVWIDTIPSDGLGGQAPSKIDVLTPRSLESDVVIDVHQIGSGEHHIGLVTRQGEVFTWGEDSGGRLGHGLDKDFGRPHLVESLAITNVSFVSCGEFHTCAVSASGDLFTWGDGTHNAGLLGHGTDVSHLKPKRVSGPLEGLQVLSVACGTWHSALVTLCGKLFTFGDGRFGVLGHGDRESVPYPKEVRLLSGQKAIKVACGVWHTAAILEVMMDQSGSNAASSRKQLFTWGDGDKYRLGHGNKETYLQPTCVSALAEYDFQQIACGDTMTVALTVSGHVFTMGSTAYGQLGNPLSDGKLPILVRDRLVGECVEEISCGAHHVAVLTSRSELYTWGRGASGRLGHGDTDDQKSPLLVEALKERHVKNISCGSNFTTCICIHKWVSGADQSTCTGCRQPFGFTRKRRNCYNCGLVHCHACSSKKVMKAALAPTPGKPHRVCESCYVKLKAAEASAAFNREITRPRSSVCGSNRIERGEVRSSRTLLSPITEPVKYLEIRTSKPGSKHDSSAIVRASQVPKGLQLKDVAFPSSLSALQNTFRPVIFPSQPQSQPPIQPPTPPAPANSRPASPYARRPSPPRSTSPGFSRSLIDSLKKKNELLNQEVSKLQKQNRSLKQKNGLQDMKIEELQKHNEETTSLAGEESSKHRVAMEFIKSMKDQLREMTEKLPPETSGCETMKMMQAQAKDFLEGKLVFESSSPPSRYESVQQSAPDIHAAESDSRELQEQRLEENDDAAAEVNPSINEGNVLQENNRSYESSTEVPLPSSNSSSLEPYKSGKEGEISVIEQFERGVYITVMVLPSGSKVFKRVRFSKRRFDEHQAEEWWNKNKDRVFKKYSPASSRDAAGTGSSIPQPHSEENVEASPSIL